MIPGSHRWGPDEQAAPDDPRAVKVRDAGRLRRALRRDARSIAAARTAERARASASRRSTASRWIRQIENLALAVPPELARGYSERVQELLGYDIFEPTFIGYVDGMHPKRLLDPEYAAKRKRKPRVELPS